MFTKVKSLFVVGILGVLVLTALSVSAQLSTLIILQVNGVKYVTTGFDIDAVVLRGLPNAEKGAGFVVATRLVVHGEDGDDALFQSDTYITPVTTRTVSENTEYKYVPIRIYIPWDRNGGLVSGEVVVVVYAELINPAGRVVEATATEYIVLLGY